MWLNFKSENRNTNNAVGGQPGRFPRSSSNVKLPNASRGISRQSSTRSSTRSVRSGKSSSNNLLKKLEEHELNTKTVEWQKNQDYKIIRERRKAIRKQIDAKLRIVRRMYIPSILGVLFGIVFLFGSTIRTLGEGTVFWNFREQFKLIGPIIIVLGVILLLTTVGLESHSLEKLKSAGIYDVKPVVHPDFLIEQTRFNRQTSKDSSGSSYDPGCSGLDKQRLLWKQSSPDEEDGFLCSSITSTSSGVAQKGKIDLTASFTTAMTINQNDSPNDAEDNINNSASDDPIVYSSTESTNLRAMYNVPCIEITDVDETSRPSALSSATSSTSSVSRISNAASLQKIDQEISASASKDETFICKNGSNLLKETGKLREITEETISQIEEHG